MLTDLSYGSLLREADHNRNEGGVQGEVESTGEEYERHRVVGVKGTNNEMGGCECEGAAQHERCRTEQDLDHPRRALGSPK